MNNTSNTETLPLASGTGSASVLFLDVDGVLNRCGQSGQGLESDKVALLKTILDEARPRVVLSSTWRKFGHQLARATKMLEDIGHDLDDITPVLDAQSSGAWGASIWTSPKRSDEIKIWLARNPGVPRFVILDDDDDAGDSALLRPYLVKTNSFEGLTPDLAHDVIRRLNTQSEPLP